jgi:uncharacterized membrane protein
MSDSAMSASETSTHPRANPWLTWMRDLSASLLVVSGVAVTIQMLNTGAIAPGWLIAMVAGLVLGVAWLMAGAICWQLRVRDHR